MLFPVSSYLLSGAVAVAQVMQSQQHLARPSLTDDVLTTPLNEAIRNILKQFNTSGGVSVAVVHKTSEGTWHLESKGYGNASFTFGPDNEETSQPVTADTLFAIGSNSKLFDVVATGLLISNPTLNPRISWSSKLSSLLPDLWKLQDPVATSESTILDLMSHRSGLPDHVWMAPVHMSTEDVISRLRYLRPSTGFREQYQYNNHMYSVLSYLPQALVGTPYETYVRENIFAPLNMTVTTFFYADALKTGRLATGFVRERNNTETIHDPFSSGRTRMLEFRYRSEKGHMVAGPGGVISSARDMAIWLRTLLTEGKNEFGETVIPAEIIQRAAAGVTVNTPVACDVLFTQHSHHEVLDRTFPELSPVVYGGGQRRSTYHGFEIIEHGGSTPGFNSQVARLPSQNLGVAVLTNEDTLGGQIREAVKYRIIDAFLKLEPIDWTARYRAQLARSPPPPALPRPKDAPPPSVPYAQLAGKYAHAAYGELDFCLFWKNAAGGSACDALVSQLPAGVIDRDVPTLISRWDRVMSEYLQLSHYSGNVFNLTALLPNNPGAGAEPWVWKVAPAAHAEFEVADNGEIGFAPISIWEAGDGVPGPQGNTVRERAEVWFKKV